jgi:serine/threonine protein kinase
VTAAPREPDTQDEELLADLFDSLLQEILEGRTPDLDQLHPDRPDLRERIAKTWSLACSVAGRREPSRPVFGGYEILRELGHGGMGTVYLARHQTLQRDVAVKVLPQSLAMSPHAKQRFVDEARALAQIRHDHVVHLHRIVDHAEMLAFEMEYIDGPSLSQLLAKLRKHDRPHSIDALADALSLPADAFGTRSSVEWLVRLTIEIARALGEVHRHGLVHRDVKPANLLLRTDGTPVLADFGLALPSDLDPRSRKFAGTPVYAAPERLRGDDLDASPVSDVYSLGVTLYEALSLTPPYQGNTTDEVLRGIEGGKATPLRRLAPHISQDLATIVQKAIEPDPRHRFASADDLADDLERLLDLQPIRARPAGPLRRAVKFVRRHQKAFLAASMSAVVVAAVAWPMAAMARERDQRAQAAAAARHRGRTALLHQESLPSWWRSVRTADRTVHLGERDEVRLEALAAALGHYDEALAATPDDAPLRLEAAAVRAAHDRLAATPTDTVDLSSLADDPFALGLYAFLLGDRTGQRQRWDDLPAAQRDDPFVDACTALRLSAEGTASLAYPRVFHAARAFPEATALIVAMADGALAAGDVDDARRWSEQLPHRDDLVLDTPRRLLAADLLAADGDVEAARRQLRELAIQLRSDPRPQLRLVELALRENDLKTVARLCRQLVRQWPDLWQARRHLARLELQRRDLPAYLAHVRHAQRSDPAHYEALLNLAGLRHQGRPLREPPVVPIQTLCDQRQRRGIMRALDVLPEFDRLTELAAHLDPTPTGSAMLTASLCALRFPDVTARLPDLGKGTLAILPLLRRELARWLNPVLLPYRTALGAHFRLIEDRIFVRYANPDYEQFYGNQVLDVGDLDGDSLPDVLISAPPGNGNVGSGFVELRSRVDGTLLSTWRSDDRFNLFGQAIANLRDVDGDVCNDILVSSPCGPGGIDEPAHVELRSGRTGDVLWRVSADKPSFGAVLAVIDDIDGDEVRDFAVGIPPLRIGEPGRVRICSGRDGRALRELDPPRQDTWFGGALAHLGDLNGDGYGELLVSGQYGRAPGLAVVFDPRTGARLLTLNDERTHTAFGYAVAALKDVDGDGFADFAIGSPGDGAGTVAVLSGRSGEPIYEVHGERRGEEFGSRLCAMPDWRGDGQPALAVGSLRGGPHGGGSIRVFDARSGAPLQTFASTGGLFGYSFSDLGDLDGDGLRDLGIMSVRGAGDVHMMVMSFADLLAGHWPGEAPTKGR